MKVAFPQFGDNFIGSQFREFLRILENAFLNLREDRRRGAITVTANYTLTVDDSLVMAAPVASGTIVISIPTVAEWMIDQKWGWNIKLIAAGTLTLTPVSGTIEGTTGVTKTVINDALENRATNDGWKLV
jgi:hypothetical protein